MKYLVVYLLLLLPFLSVAQIITLKDHETGQILEYATLLSQDKNVFTTSDASGKVNIKAFKGASHIEIRMLGYQTEVKSYSDLVQNNRVLFLSPSGIQLNQLVVSGTRTNALKKDIPSKIVLLSRKTSGFQNPQTQADLLELSGSVYVQKSQMGGGSPMIRGFSANRLLYSVDGIRMNTAIFRSGNLQNVISLDPFATRNTEILMGPGSVMYGSDAIGGVMNFQTLTPHFSLNDTLVFSGNGVLRTSSANFEKTAHTDFTIGLKKWAFTTSLTFSDYNDLTMGSKGPDEYLRPFYAEPHIDGDKSITNKDPKIQTPSAYAQINVMQKIRFKANNFLDFTYGLHYSNTSNYSRYDRLLRTKNNLPRSAEWYYGPQKWMMNNLTVSHTKTNIFYNSLTLRAAYQRFEESRNDRDFNAPILYKRFEEVNAYSINVDLSKSFGSTHTISYGLEGVLNDVNSKGTDENIILGEKTAGPSRYPNSLWSSYALYASHQYKVSPKLSVLSGLRYNIFQLKSEFDNTFYPLPFTTTKSNNDAFSGTIGTVYSPTKEWIIRANLATGFRAPNVDDMGKIFDSEPGSVVVPNPNLKAEHVYNAEIGIARIFNNMFEIEATAYFTRLNNAMVRRNFQLNGLDSIMYDGELSQVQAIQNAAFATIYGIEAEYELNLNGGFEFFGTISYQKGTEEFEDGSKSPSRHAAPLFGRSHFVYAKRNFKADIYTTFNGARPFEDMPEEEKGKAYIYATDKNGNPWSPGWITLNAKLMYNISPKVSAFAGIENITDVRYRPYSSGLVAPGRNFILSLKANF